MPLKLDLKTGEKMIINGAVLENVGNNAQMLVLNKASILREREILAQQDAVTPASRVYFEIQCAYIFRESRDEHLKRYASFLRDYLQACPSAQDIGDTIGGHVENGDLYKALKATRKLITHEMNTFDQFHQSVGKLAEISEEGEADSAAQGSL